MVELGRMAGDVMRATQVSLPSLDALGQEWIDLERRAAASFFTSWCWIGSWLKTLPAAVQPTLMRVEHEGRIVGLGLLGKARIRRARVIPSKRLTLNATGDSSLDDITIEYNGLLCERGTEASALRCCVDMLLGRDDWDEFALPGLAQRECVELERAVRAPARVVVEARNVCRYVDIEALRSSGTDYVRSLGKNARQHLRRSRKEFEKLGPLAIDAATSLQEAQVYLAELRRFHQAYWISRGHPGAFANEYFCKFHDVLLACGFPSGAVQLLRARAGDRVLGYLYNFVYDARVQNYQSGFDYSLVTNQHHRPGLVTHALAIEYNQSVENRIYDFLAGETQYKKDLGTHSLEICWAIVRRRRLRFLLEDGLRWAKPYVESWFTPTTALSRLCRRRSELPNG